MSNIDTIISQLESDREAIERAIAALSEISDRTRTAGAKKSASGPAAAPKKRHMSAAGRKRISEAAKRRWALQRGPAEDNGAPAAKKGTKKKAAKKAFKKAARGKRAAKKAAAGEPAVSE